jgi:predicted ATPase/DNA-binding SARP family transcriptional activator/DNA-binding CsgD family transcriptional regulator
MKETSNGRLEPMRVRLLGGFRVSVGSRVIEEGEWRLRKAQSLVKLLALSPGHKLHRERVMDLLWPDLGIRAASNNLRGALHVARRTLEPAPAAVSRYLVLREEQLTLCPGGQLWVDVEAFEETAEEARRSREPAAYRAAIELYAGDLLPEDRYEDWAERRRAELRRTYLDLLVGLAGLHEERGEYQRGIEALRKAVAEEPTRVEAHVGLMRLHALSGRRVEALGQHQRLESILSEQLGAEPDSESRRLREEISSGRFPPPTPTRQERPLEEHPDAHNLPTQRTSFVGRESEMVELKRLLSMTGLLTLTGAGGCGKTRLALEVTGELAGVYPDGVWLVELAPLSEPDLVVRQVARALGIREQPERPLMEMLVEHLRQKKVLLVLDNCEHLVDAASTLAGVLLGSCPRVKILATSREPLGVAGEVNWLVPSLSVPGTDHLPGAENLARYESVRLFVERARLRLPTFELAPENAGSVAEVCRKLDGVPLAIELAAARMDILRADQIAERLDRALALLTGGSETVELRHRTLRAALDWGYELLGEPERRLFRRLSAFAGGWTLEAAEAVGTGDGIEEGDVLELFLLLVDKSLVVAEPDGKGGFRYGMLEPVRQYAREKLEESGEAEATRRRHAAFFLALAERAEPELTGRNQPEWLDRLEAEHNNLRAALGWSLQQPDVEPGLRLAAAVWMFWHTHGHLSEGRAWLERAISAGGVPYTRAKALVGVGWMSMFQGDYEAAKTFFERGLTLFRELRDEDGIVTCITNLGLVAVLGERQDIPVPTLLEEATRLRPRVANPRTVANLLILSGLVAFARGDIEQAWALHEESLEISREIGDAGVMIVCLTNLGLMAVGRGDHARASALLEENLHLARRSDDKMPLQYALFGLAGVAAASGEPARAARLWGASEAVREAAGLHLTALARTGTNYEAHLEAARSRLGEAAFAGAWAEGRAMPQEEAIEYALSEEAVPAPERAPANALTRREEEVTALVARGLTNRQVARELSISEHTVAAHVAKILKKLGLRSRSQLPPG